MTFDEAVPIIDELLSKRRSRWYLQVNDIDYDDACQIIKTHIFRKFDQYDPKKPFEPWANTIISNQTRNIVRNNLKNLQKPCDGCPWNLENKENSKGLTCSYTSSGEQCAECPLFARWSGAKKYGWNIRTASSLESMNDSGVEFTEDNSGFDVDAAMGQLDDILKQKLSKHDYKAYRLLFIDNVPEEVALEQLGYGKNIPQQKVYKTIRNYKKKLRELVIKTVREEGIV